MFRPVKMSKVNILLLNKYVTVITKLLGQRGLVHLVEAVDQSGDKLLSNVDQEKEDKSIFELTSRCERLIEGLGVDPTSTPPETNQEMSLDDIRALVDKIYVKYHEQEMAIDTLLSDSGILDKERSAIAAFPFQHINLEALRNLSHFYMVTGHLEPTVVQRAILELGDRAVVVQSDNNDGNVLILSSNKSRWAVKDLLEKLRFSALETPQDVTGEVEEAVEKKTFELEKLQNDLEECRLNVLKLSETYGGVLLVMLQQLKGLLAVHSAQKHFGRVAHLYCISGWTPASEVATVRDLVYEVTNGTGIVEVIDASDDTLVKAGLEQVPVKFEGGKILRPFQMLVSNFGLPQYNELDPTVFVAITFVLLFGFMFGDIGQGLVLAGIGLWLAKTRKKLDQVYKDAGVLLLFCGLSATVFGFFYGSVFGYENHEVLKPLWLSPLKESEITTLLLTAVGVGIVFSSVAIIINIINHFIARKYFDGVFERFGLLGLMFYWFALGTGVWVILKKSVPSFAIVMIIIPLVLLFLRGPLRRFVFKKKQKPDEEEEKEGLFNMGLEACIELMETFTGYISGTVSFVRVGAFAISHAALCLAIFSIVNMVKDAELPGGTAIQLVIIILGNMLVIAFEGMVAMIQGVRLEYYELFGKYFNGGGVEYKPFQINRQNNEEK